MTRPICLLVDDSHKLDPRVHQVARYRDLSTSNLVRCLLVAAGTQDDLASRLDGSL
jgi:hypothetical protein